MKTPILIPATPGEVATKITMVPQNDPFKEAREAGAVAGCDFDGEHMPMLLRHKDVRDATRDWKTFSSDAPFRVPIPSEESVRSVRQLPIETDPPEHTDYRRIIEPFFNRPREEWMQDAMRELIVAMIREVLAAGPIEVVGGFALPMQSRALAILLGVPEAEAEEWISWGVNVFKDAQSEGLNEEKGARLDNYIQRRLDLAESAPGDDFFSALTQAEFRGRRLTREESTGFCNLVFAGGRDTIIHTISSIIAHMAEQPEILSQLRENPKLVMSATEEFIRYISPITHLGRVCPHGAEVSGAKVEPDKRVSLCWASANRDESVFDAPDELHLDRKPNPHVAFGSGPHTCVGALHARVMIRILLEELSASVGSIRIAESVRHIEPIAQFQREIGFDRLLVGFHLQP
jgi:cytochrome P450